MQGFSAPLDCLNGNFTPSGAFYELDIPVASGACSMGTAYVYFTSGQWYIGQTLGSTVDPLAVCDAAVFVENPWDCGANWADAGPGGSAFPAVSASSCAPTSEASSPVPAVPPIGIALLIAGVLLGVRILQRKRRGAG